LIKNRDSCPKQDYSIYQYMNSFRSIIIGWKSHISVVDLIPSPYREVTITPFAENQLHPYPEGSLIFSNLTAVCRQADFRVGAESC